MAPKRPKTLLDKYCTSPDRSETLVFPGLHYVPGNALGAFFAFFFFEKKNRGGAPALPSRCEGATGMC